MRGFAKSAGAKGAEFSLIPASTSHIKFIDDGPTFHVRHPDMKGQERSPDSKITEEKAACRAPAINPLKPAIHEPTEARTLGITENPGRSYFLEFFL